MVIKSLILSIYALAEANVNFLYMWNSSLIHSIYALEKKYYTFGEHREERRKSFLQVGLVLQVKSSFIA